MPLTQRSLQGLWLKALLLALFGYALLGKGFAYLFLGELILVLGVLIFLQSQRVMLVFSDPVLFLWGVFAFWGFCRTVPFFSKYHFDAVRDAVLWAYGLFALLIAAFINASSQISRALNGYRRFLRWYLPVLPLLVPLTLFRSIQPTLPWAKDVTVVMVRAGELAVHLTAAVLFLLIFPDRGADSGKQGVSIYRLIGFVGLSFGVLEVIVTSRGGFLALMVPIILVSILRTQKIGLKVAAFGAIIVISSLLFLESNLVTVTIKGQPVTTDQINDKIGSIFGGGHSSGALEDDKTFRLVWWRKIVQYTIFGPYFWTGKGFGVNLSVEDGPPGMQKDQLLLLRSPHNGNMTVLARMGVPGVIIWTALNVVFVFRLFTAYRRAVRSGSRFWSGVNLWILCYWMTAFINMSFDVYLEGPQGGIWFWSVIGFGVAALRVQAYEERQLLAQAHIRSAETSNFEYSSVCA